MIDCVTPASRGRNFCRNQINNLNDPNAPDSVLRYRTITGICNNIEPGQATVGASETVLPRLRRKLQNAQFQSIRYKKKLLTTFTAWKFFKWTETEASFISDWKSFLAVI